MAGTESSPTDLVDIAEVARTTALSRRTLYRRIDDGSFPKPKRVGGKNLWMRAWVERWKADTMRDAAPDDGGGHVGTM